MTEAQADFEPHRLLRNPHLQSVLASARLRRALIRRRGSAMERAARREVLDCGDGVRLEAHHSPRDDARGLVVLLHGWEGCHDSVYLYSLASHLFDHGYAVVRLNLRDHGGTHALNEELFHSARMDEVYGALAAIRRLTGCDRFLLAGFSLGGNFAMRVAAWGADHGVAPAHVVAVNPAINPRATTAALDASRWLYRPYFMRKWRRSRAAKQRAHPQRYDFREFERLQRFDEITAAFAERFTPYGSLDRYFAAYTITPETLAGASTPLTIITADDDPVVPVGDFHGFRDLPQVALVVARHGGHCGYVEDFKLQSWLDRRVAAIFDRYASTDS